MPLAFNAADLLEKVIWLKKHPRMARKIALNGRNFGLSHLRLEDYYCYTAALLEGLGEISDPSALKDFDAQLVEEFLN